MELLVAASALATDSVEGQRSRPSGVMRLDLLKVVGSRPARLASPEGDNPPRSASRSSAVQIWPWVSIRCAFGCLAMAQSRSKARNYYALIYLTKVQLFLGYRYWHGVASWLLGFVGCVSAL